MLIDESHAISENKEKEKHFKIVQGQFLSSVLEAGNRTPHVVKVEYIVNPLLRQKFKETEAEFTAKGKPTRKVYGFHKTEESVISRIVEEGFKIGGETTAVGHHDAYGKGVYLCTSPVVPDCYTRGTFLG